MIEERKNQISEFSLSRMFLGLIVFLTVFDGIRIFNFPVLNSLLFLCSPFVLRYLKLNIKNKADANLIFFLWCYFILIILTILSGVLFGSNILFDFRAAITNTGFILQILIVFFYVKRVMDIKTVLYPMVLAMGVYSFLNILCVIGLIEPLNYDLKNEMRYMSQGIFSDLVVGKGLFYYMTNGNYGLITIFGIAACIILIDAKKNSFLHGLLLKSTSLIILLAAFVIQSRALLVVLIIYVLLLMINRQKKYSIRFFISLMLSIIITVFIIYLGSSFFEILFSNRSGFDTRFEQARYAISVSINNIFLGASLSSVNEYAMQNFGVPIHNYFLRILSGNGILALLVSTLPLIMLLHLVISQRSHLKYSYVIFSALFAQVLMINFYPGTSIKPIALNIGFTLAYLSIYFEAKKDYSYKKHIINSQ